jgi:phosphatidylglycerophosphatase A
MTLTRYFFIQHHKSSPYHPQANGTMEAFNKILEMGMTKVCCEKWDDWDERVLVLLWAYRTTTNRLKKYTPFLLVYDQEAVVKDEFLTPSLFITQATKMTEDESIVAWVEELLELEEARFLEYFH